MLVINLLLNYIFVICREVIVKKPTTADFVRYDFVKYLAFFDSQCQWPGIFKFRQAVYVMHRTEDEKAEWLKVLEDTIRDSLCRRSSFMLSNQPTSPKINVSRARHLCSISAIIVCRMVTSLNSLQRFSFGGRNPHLQ